MRRMYCFLGKPLFWLIKGGKEIFQQWLTHRPLAYKITPLEISFYIRSKESLPKFDSLVLTTYSGSKILLLTGWLALNMLFNILSFIICFEISLFSSLRLVTEAMKLWRREKKFVLHFLLHLKLEKLEPWCLIVLSYDGKGIKFVQ